MLRAQEEERARIAQDLHDEVNQALTAILLRLQAAALDVPHGLRSELKEIQTLATQAMEELLTLARQLRPTALDDHGIVRGGMKLLIDRQPDMEVVAEAGDGVEAFEQALATRPDLCVMDVSMPRMTGLQAARQIRAHLPETQVLALSMHDDERYVFDALKAGASGYVLKREVDQALLNAIRAVHRGETFLTNAVERTVVREWMRDDASGPEEPLSPREQEVLKLIAEAHTNKQIAEILHLAEETVESHRANLLRKLGMRDRVELVRYAIRRGLTEA